MSSLSEFSKRFSAFGREMRRTMKEFLPKEAGRYERIWKATVQATVYDVYTPVEYERTGNLKKSGRAYLPNESDTKTLFIDSDPGIAIAKMPYIKDGYAQFVAGEGPGIGFLNTAQGFPREFPEAVYNILGAEVPNRLMEKLDKVIAKL